MGDLVEDGQELVGGASDAVVAVSDAGCVVAGEIAHDIVAADLLDEPVVERSRLCDRLRPEPTFSDEFPGGSPHERGAQVAGLGGDGLVPARTLGDEYFRWEEAAQALVGAVLEAERTLAAAEARLRRALAGMAAAVRR